MADVINRGLAPGDKSADSAYVGAGKINEKFAEIDAGGSFSRLNISNALLTASFRADGNGNLGWYVGAAGAADGSQIKAATLNKASGTISVGSGFNVSAANPRAWIAHTGASPSTLGFGADAGATWLGPHTNSDFYVITNNAERMRIDASGNIGVGTSSPVAKLDIAGSGLTSLFVRDTTAGGRFAVFSHVGSYAYVGAAGASLGIAFQINSVDRFIIGASELLPALDNALDLGSGSLRMRVIYAATGTINTSDAREKTPVRGLAAAEIAAARDLSSEIGIYQWLDMIAEKGEANARLHVGMTVQRAIEIMESHGLDPWRFGFICRDEITRKVKVMRMQTEQATVDVEETFTEIEIREGVPVQVQKMRTVQRPQVQMVAVVDEAGQPVMQEVNVEIGRDAGGEPIIIRQLEPLLHPIPVMIEVEREVEIDEPAGDRLGFRYDQLALFIMRGLLARVEALEA